MKIIGMYPSSSFIKESQSLSYILDLVYRFGCCFLGVMLNIAMLMLVFVEELKEESFTGTYNKNIDYLNSAVHAIAVHLYLLIFWVKPLDLLKDSLLYTDLLMGRNRESSISPSIRTLTSAGITYIILSVNQNFSLKYYIKLNLIIVFTWITTASGVYYPISSARNYSSHGWICWNN